MIFNMEFKSNFAKMISWAIVLIILLGLMLAFYPFLAESQMNSLFNSVMESFNEPTRNILGIYEGMDIVNIGDDKCRCKCSFVYSENKSWNFRRNNERI